MAFSVSVVIPTLNGGALFGEVLEKLKRQKYDGPVDIYVVDSGSTDETLDLARKHGATINEISKRDFNHGLTRNFGIAATRGDIILLITQDAVPADDFLIANLAKNYEDPLVGGCFAKQIPRPEHDVLVKRGVQNWVAGQSVRKVSHIADRAAYDRLKPMDKFLFCVFDDVCSSVRRKTWEQIPFRKNDFAEDLDWSKRVLEGGWKIVFEPTAAVVHSHDRPVSYEYKRTYMCHRKLYELFGVRTVPHKKYVLRNMLSATVGDIGYVWKNEPRLMKRLSLICRVPVWSVAGVLGQYHGGRDEAEGQGKKLSGV